jgi:hypothetical protein
MVALVIDEHLRLVLETAERGAVHDPVAVALERAAQPALRLRVTAAPAPLRIARMGRQGSAGGALEAWAAV